MRLPDIVLHTSDAEVKIGQLGVVAPRVDHSGVNNLVTLGLHGEGFAVAMRDPSNKIAALLHTDAHTQILPAMKVAAKFFRLLGSRGVDLNTVNALNSSTNPAELDNRVERMNELAKTLRGLGINAGQWEDLGSESVVGVLEDPVVGPTVISEENIVGGSTRRLQYIATQRLIDILDMVSEKRRNPRNSISGFPPIRWAHRPSLDLGHTYRQF